MPWKLSPTKRFSKDLNAVASADARRFIASIDRLVLYPAGADIRKLEGGAGWRMRVGNWRVFFELDTETGIILLTGVKRRTSTTY